MYSNFLSIIVCLGINILGQIFTHYASKGFKVTFVKKCTCPIQVINVVDVILTHIVCKNKNFDNISPRYQNLIGKHTVSRVIKIARARSELPKRECIPDIVSVRACTVARAYVPARPGGRSTIQGCDVVGLNVRASRVLLNLGVGTALVFAYTLSCSRIAVVPASRRPSRTE